MWSGYIHLFVERKNIYYGYISGFLCGVVLIVCFFSSSSFRLFVFVFLVFQASMLSIVRINVKGYYFFNERFHFSRGSKLLSKAELRSDPVIILLLSLPLHTPMHAPETLSSFDWGEQGAF